VLRLQAFAPLKVAGLALHSTTCVV
jgi:hypothetical protein